MIGDHGPASNNGLHVQRTNVAEQDSLSPTNQDSGNLPGLKELSYQRMSRTGRITVADVA